VSGGVALARRSLKDGSPDRSEAMTSLAYDEIETAELGDRRLNAHLGKVLE
jgi:hypothetical protein